MRFIDEHRHDRVPGVAGKEFGVEPICRVLTEHGCQIAPATYWAHAKRPACGRAVRDAELIGQIRRVHEDNYGVYGARKVWRQLNREDIGVPRCTVERLMAAEGLATWSGFVYVAFCIDVFARVITGWRVSRSMSTDLVLDAPADGHLAAPRAGHSIQGLVHHSDAGRQYTSIRYTERLAEAGATPSIGSVGDSYDNAMAESIIGLFKTGVIRHHRPWRTPDDVEIATLQWVDWFTNRRLFEALGHTPRPKPKRATTSPSISPRPTKCQNRASTEPGAVQCPGRT